MWKEIVHLVRYAPSTLMQRRQSDGVTFYDTLMKRADDQGMSQWRRRLVAGLHGRVLEVGCGTGLMFPYYEQGVEVDAIEPSDKFRERAVIRAGQQALPIRVHEASAEQLPFSDSTFDGVVISMVLCSVEDLSQVLGELKRVSKAETEFRLMEHVCSPDPTAGKVMDMLDPVWMKLNGMGCHMNRPTEALLREHGFVLQETYAFQMFTPGVPAFPMRWIRAFQAG
jgi:ubiquinone/menaquinone biosynthesis C-methylase UbiE